MFDGENISFDASLVIYTNSTNIPPIMIINRIYDTKSSVAVACFLSGRAKDLSSNAKVSDNLLFPSLMHNMRLIFIARRCKHSVPPPETVEPFYQITSHP